MPTLTIITPTYNRAHCLEDCWNSLKSQTCADFQWLVSDDGSSDNTAELIARIREENPRFCIDYIRKENGGKHTALNATHPHIKGKYVMVLDSDDHLTSTAVEQVIAAWKRYDSDRTVGQVIFLKGYSEEKPICYVEHEDTPVDTLEEPRIRVSGRDCADSYRTELFVKHSFQEYPGERFLGEGSAFFFIELESKGVYINQVIYLCDYREDGLTKAGKKMRLNNPLGGRYNSTVYMHPRLPAKTRIRKALLYVCYSHFAGFSLGRMIAENPYKLLTCLALLPGTALYFYWKKRYFS